MIHIIEIGFEIKDQEDYDFLEDLLDRLGIPYYIEPLGEFKTLEELEIKCEGK